MKSGTTPLSALLRLLGTSLRGEHGAVNGFSAGTDREVLTGYFNLDDGIEICLFL